MGQEGSSMVDDSVPPEALKERSLEAVAEYIKSGRCKRVVVMTGAGISTSAGIPDFRSPDTGLYANLARLNLPYAEAVFDISFFRENPIPFYTLAHELYPGRYRPTITHSFIALLHKKELLYKLFTQNIDCLEREAGVPDDLIVEAHGSFARQSCIDCHAPYPADLMRERIDKKEVPRCRAPGCSGLVKPEIVFFGEQLPASFFENRTKPAEADLAIVLGTSLTVQPFASLPGFCGEGVPRLLINKEQVGGLGSRADDVLELGDCDEGVRRLAEALGWLDELEREWAKTAPSKASAHLEAKKEKEPEDEVEKLTREVDESLKISEKHQKDVNGLLDQSKDGDSKDAASQAMSDQSKTAEEKVQQEPDAQAGASADKEVLKPPEKTATDEKGNVKVEPTGSDAAALKHVYPHM